MSPNKDTITDILTPRQVECMRLVERGLTAKQIAHQLTISHRTVEQHISDAMDSLGANNRLAAVARMRELEPEKAELPAYAFMLREVDTVDSYLQPKLPKGRHDGAQIDEEWPIVPGIGGEVNGAPLAMRKAWMIRIAIIAILLTVIPILTIMGLSEIALRAE